MFAASFKQERLLGGAIVLAVTQVGASVVGLIRDRVLVASYPSLGIVDVYVASFRPGDLLFQVAIMSAMGTVLVPFLATRKARGEGKEMDGLLSGTMAVGAIVFGAIALALAAFFPLIAPYLVQFEGERLRLYIQFGQLALLSNFLFVFGNAFGQYLITVQRYWIYGLTPIIYTLGTILGTVLFAPWPLAPIVGTLAGAVCYVILRFFGVLYAGYRPTLRLWHPDLMNMGVLMVPRMLALGATQIQLLLFDTIASGMDTGSVTINAYTRNFQSVVVGAAGIALAQSAYSLLSQAAARNEMKRFRMYIEKGLTMLLLFTIPGSVALILLSPVAASLVHLRHVLPVFALMLALYAISIPFESINHLFLRGFYAFKDTATPALLGIVTGLGAVLVAWLLAGRLGIFGLAFSYTVTQTIETMALGVLLERKMKRKA
jgi:putative peptidoglycan lipid II flippase